MMIKETQVSYYEELLKQHGENFRALDWKSLESQKLRYQIFKEIFIYGKKTVNISVLDVGCGFGDFYGFLKAEGLLSRQRINYLGFDISEKLLAVAKKKYPEARFELKDILAERHLSKFDYLFASGIFNIQTEDQENHLEVVKTMLLRMYDLANQAIAVNFLSEGSLPVSNVYEPTPYFYFKPEEILNFSRHICSRYILRHDYHPGDFTLYLFK